MTDKENNTGVSDFIDNTKKILNMLEKLDVKLFTLENDLTEVKWELDDIKNSISPKTSKPVPVKVNYSVVTSSTKKFQPELKSNSS